MHSIEKGWTKSCWIQGHAITTLLCLVLMLSLMMLLLSCMVSWETETESNVDKDAELNI